MAVRSPLRDFDLWHMYHLMLLSRRFEETTMQLWMEGLIAGEMHLGIGEEATAAGVVSHMRSDDAMALHHRATPFLLMRDVDPAGLLKEFLGLEHGLCGGLGGHMHLYLKEHLAASSGIVGASGPCGVGFALAADTLRPGLVAIAVFGEGALNQGMLLESLNLAASWRLPVVFVCLDDSWSITTLSCSQRRATPCARVEGFGIPTEHVDGLDVEAVWHAAGRAFDRSRDHRGPTFLHALCPHPEGHFLGDLLLEVVRDPIHQLPKIGIPLVRSAISPGGASIAERLRAVMEIFQRVQENLHDRTAAEDPLNRLRLQLSSTPYRLTNLELEVHEQLLWTLQDVLHEYQEEIDHANAQL
jgi:TPP-dependent pyruvate/acetoin dehydrogenase alpha subunit